MQQHKWFGSFSSIGRNSKLLKSEKDEEFPQRQWPITCERIKFEIGEKVVKNQ